MTEIIKKKPVNKRKLLRRTLTTAAMAVIFGLIACVTFLVLEPVISRWLNPEEEPQHVIFPEDLEEMAPEDMLAGSTGEETPQPSGKDFSDSVQLEEEQIQEILSGVVLDLDNYKELYNSLSGYVNRLSQSMVTVTAVKSNKDWFNDVLESTNQCYGLILEENGRELLILTSYSAVATAEKLTLTFFNDMQAEAQLKQQDLTTDMAVLSVELSELPFELSEEDSIMAVLGSSNIKNFSGTPVVALGSPMGSYGSVGYGIIASSNIQFYATDRNYKIMMTDIAGSKDASGILFNLQGQVIGVITNAKTGTDMDSMVHAYGITELKKVIENLSNNVKIPYLGISGMDVSKEANGELGVPYGAYVRQVDFDSPAMRMGIQRGDVIIGMNDKVITNFANYSNGLLQMEAGQTIELTVMRMVRNEYREMKFSIELGEVKQ